MTKDRLRSPVSLLAAQGVALGLLSGFVIIPAAGIFLARYGSKGLPWVYLMVAVAGGVTSPAMSYAVRRWSLASVAVPVLAFETAIVALVWLGLELAHADWLSFVLQVIFPLLLQVGFVLIGGQAGRLLTVREMKERFPRIVAGFVVGFFLAGLLAPGLLAVVGATERLLAGTCLCAMILLGLVLYTRRLYPAELSGVEASPGPSAHVASARPRTAPARRFVIALLGYQVLSMLGTQLVDFLVFDRAAARFKTSEDLARFTSVFTVVLNVSDLLFLAVVAGFLLRRFGMRLGLVANPAVVTVLVILGVVSGSALGVGSIAMFVTMCGARTSDIALTDGATRTAINTAYQALPTAQRLGAQATVEGIGGPIAIGLTGIVLLVVQRGFDGGPIAVAVIAAVAGLVWMLSGSAVYRLYQTNLRDSLRSRALRPTDLSIDDEATGAVVHRLLQGDPTEVSVALDLIAAQPDAVTRLVALASPPGSPGRSRGADPGSLVRTAALRRLASLDPLAATRPALNRHYADPIVRLAAVASQVRGGGSPSEPMRDEVRRLLHDDDADVQAAAFRAAVAIGDESMLGLVLDALTSAQTASMASAALMSDHSRFGAMLDVHLTDPLAVPSHLVRLVRSCPRTTDTGLATVLARHTSHPSREVGLAVLQALGKTATQTDGARLEAATAVTSADAAHTVRLLQALVALGDAPETHALCEALHDELLLLRRRTLVALALVVDPAAIGKAGQWLEGGDERAAALALETLEVTMPPVLRPTAVLLLHAGGDHRRRLHQLEKVVPEASRSLELDDALTDLVEDAAGMWRRSWLQACALHAAVSLRRPVAARLLQHAAEMSANGPVREIVTWARAPESFSQQD